MSKQTEPSPIRPSVSLVDPLDLLELWPRVSWLVKRVIDRAGRCYRPQDVFDFIHRGMWQLWTAESDGEVVSIAITSIENYPTRRECLVRYAAGNMVVILENLKMLEGWAVEQKCQSIKCYGRQGWARNLGWEFRHVVLEKDLV